MAYFVHSHTDGIASFCSLRVIETDGGMELMNQFIKESKAAPFYLLLRIALLASLFQPEKQKWTTTPGLH